MAILVIFMMVHSALVRVNSKCPLLLCWAAKAIIQNGPEFLVLPPTIENGKHSPTHWIDAGGLTYPSNAIFILKSYKDLADMILKEAASHPLNNEVRMILLVRHNWNSKIILHLGGHQEPFASSSRRCSSGGKNKQAGSKGCLYHLVAGDAGCWLAGPCGGWLIREPLSVEVRHSRLERPRIKRSLISLIGGCATLVWRDHGEAKD